MGNGRHVVVVGAGLGGLRTVERLRECDFTGRISLVGDEVHLPYDRPPLSKQFLSGEFDAERIRLTDLEALAQLEVDCHLGRRAVDLGADGRVELDDGTVLLGDDVVLATGVQARRIPDQPACVHTVRTMDDALRLRAEMTEGASLLVIGAGFVGAEVASTAIDRGMKVTLLEAGQVPLSRGLGLDVGQMAARLIREGGVDLRTGSAIVRFLDTDSGVAVELSDGSVIDADVGVVGIGGRPALEWLDGSGLSLDDGVLCDERGRALGLDHVWAVGDMSKWKGSDGRHHRHEHWTSTADQALVVAREISGGERPAPTVPYFWSDQFGLKIQLIGRPDEADSVAPLRGEGVCGGAIKGSVIGYFRGDRLVAVGGFGAGRVVLRFRALLLEGADRDRAHEFAASF